MQYKDNLGEQFSKYFEKLDDYHKDNLGEQFYKWFEKVMDEHRFAKLYDEQRQQFRYRWEKPLLDPETKQQIIVEGCKTFQELLTKRLKEIKEVLLPEIENVDVSMDSEEKRKEYQKIWQKIAEKKFRETMLDIKKYGLEDYKELTDVEKDRLGRSYSIDLRSADLPSMHFEGANLNGAYFDSADCSEAHFDSAFCDDAHFDKAMCLGAHFVRAHCTNTNFDSAICLGAHFDRAHCTNIHFEGGFCNNARFKDAYCFEAHFEGANCVSAHFEGAHCWDAHFDGANCVNAHFDDAQCYGISFGAIEKIDENGVIHRRPCYLGDVTYKGANFLHVDTSNVDWSRNPGMKSYIEHQQFIQDIWDKANTKFLRFLFKVWGKTSNYGKSFWQWLLSCVWIIIIFTGFYCLDLIKNFDFFQISDKIVHTPSQIFSYFYFSVVTFSTLGFGDVTPIHLVSMILVMVEVILGYFMLGGLITFLVKWLGRK